VLRAFPGDRATLAGRLWFPNGARDDIVSHLVLDGRNSAELPSPSVNGVGIRFVEDEVTNLNTNICFVLGSPWGRAIGTVIERSRIHNCGQIPAGNHHHGIYVADADRTRIVENLIYDNADRGIQLYPDAQHTVIERNVINGNGTGILFSGAGGVASSDNIAQYNVITNSGVRADVESWYPDGNPVGENNLVLHNCLFGGHTGTISAGFGGFTAGSNLVANPRYSNPLAGDFRMTSASPCRRILRRRPGSSHPAGRRR
jgi:parallel beta-helix repeat protein